MCDKSLSEVAAVGYHFANDVSTRFLELDSSHVMAQAERIMSTRVYIQGIARILCRPKKINRCSNKGGIIFGCLKCNIPQKFDNNRACDLVQNG